TRSSHITDQLDSCSTASIGCRWLSKYWDSRTRDGCIDTLATNCRRHIINYGYCLANRGAVVAAGISGIPSPCDDLSASLGNGYVAETVYGCSTACITCRRSSETRA